MGYRPPGDEIALGKLRLGDTVAAMKRKDGTVWIVGDITSLTPVEIGGDDGYYTDSRDVIILVERKMVPLDQIPVGARITEVGADGVHFEFAIKADSSHWWGFGKSLDTPPVLIPSMELDYWDYEA